MTALVKGGRYTVDGVEVRITGLTTSVRQPDTKWVWYLPTAPSAMGGHQLVRWMGLDEFLVKAAEGGSDHV